jgi:hypothetical protein
MSVTWQSRWPLELLCILHKQLTLTDRGDDQLKDALVILHSPMNEATTECQSRSLVNGLLDTDNA